VTADRCAAASERLIELRIPGGSLHWKPHRRDHQLAEFSGAILVIARFGGRTATNRWCVQT
jgi:hypothetical protein